MDTEFGNAALLGMLECNLFVEVTFLVACNLLFSLQPSKLDLDVFIAICQVDLDARKYPNIVQWKKLVMSHSEATQQRLHFIYFKFKLLHLFLLLFSVPLPSCCPCMPHPLHSGSLTPSLSGFLPPAIPALPPSLPISFLHSLPASHSLPHCLPSLTPSFIPSPSLPLPPSLLLSLVPSLLPELCPLPTSLTFYLPPSLAPPLLPGPNKNSIQSHM